LGVKIRKIRGKWYLVIDYRGRRKKKAISASRAVAEDVRRKVEARLAAGDVGIFGDNEGTAPIFREYAERWLRERAQSVKSSTYRSYEQLLRLHVTPRFGSRRLAEISREDVKKFVSSLSENPDHSRNTVRLIITALRAVLSAALEDGMIQSNPASGVGKFNRKAKGEAKAQAMTRLEAESFLLACQNTCPDYNALFFTALRAGLRKGELIALKWGDIQFGESENDNNRFIHVQRNCYQGKMTSPKGNRPRRVDMTKQLRAVLLEWKDAALVQAFQFGKTSIVDDLVFPSEAGTPICADNIAPRYMEPALENAGLRKFRFHDLRHTFGSLLIQAGVSVAYVQKQMGHTSVQVTVDTYGHLIPGENVSWIDVLDSKKAEISPATSAHPAHTREDVGFVEVENRLEPEENTEDIWLPPRDSNPDMLIQSQCLLNREIPGFCRRIRHLPDYGFPRCAVKCAVN
jgi:integrase